MSGTGAEQHAHWQAQRTELLRNGSAKTLDVTSVTRLVEEEEDARARLATAAAAVEIVEVAGRDLQRPHGKRFGSLVHELLARVSLDAARDSVAALADALARTFDAPGSESDAAAEAVVRALEHPLLARARSASECHRETPLLHRAPSGRLIEAIPDLVFRDGAGETWTVVDFKTDLRPDLSAEPYRAQVALYGEALEAATGTSARGVLLFV